MWGFMLAGVITIPFHIGDFISGTMHMDATERGAYIMLLCAHYQVGEIGLPDDDKKLSRIAGVSPKTWSRIKPTLQEKFTVTNGFWKNSKTIDTLQKVAQLSANQRAKALKKHNSAYATAQPRHSQPKPKPNNIDKSILPPIVPQGDVLPGWMPVDAWNGYCKHRGKKFTENAKRLAIKKLELWQAEGIDISEVLNNSVMNGWTGLFKTKEVKNETSGRVLTKHERLQLAAAKAVEQLSGQEPQSAISGPDKPKLRGF